jgi:hypothetical protein
VVVVVVLVVVSSSSTNKMHTGILILIYIHYDLLHVTAKHTAIVKEVKYRGRVFYCSFTFLFQFFIIHIQKHVTHTFLSLHNDE